MDTPMNYTFVLSTALCLDVFVLSLMCLCYRLLCEL